MANTIKPKRSNTASKVPNTTELVSGELGVNMADRKVYINNGTSVVQVGAGLLSALGDVTITSPTSGQGLSYNGTAWVNATGAGSGDVVGGSSSTDNAITRYDGTTGKVIQNSVVIIDDSGNVSGVNSITDPDTIGFNTAYATPLTAGKLGWDSTYNTLGFGMSGGNIIQHIGEDTYIYIKATAAITKGQVIMFTGSVGASGVLTGAPATGVTNGQYIVGVAAESIALNGFGYVQTFGELRNVNTSAFADGDILYYNSAVTGGFTTTFPTSGLIVTVAAVVNGGSVGGGVIQVRVTVTQRITASTGITVSQTNAGTSVANSGVLGVTATSPVASSGGQNPVISMPAATTSVSGYLTSTDWNTFNNKTSNTGTVTSVSASVPTGLSIAGSPITTSGTLAITYTAGYAIPTTASQTNWDTAFTDRLKWDGGATGLVAATGRTSLGATTVGGNFFTLTNPTAITFPRMNADNTVSALDAATFRTAIGAGTGSGTVTSVTGTAPVVSSGGATPAISMAAATTSVNGYLTSTDWNTFNGKQAALGFTPYNATNPSNYIALASAITGYTVGTNTALASTDTLLAGLGKIQGQINARGTGTVTGVTATSPVASSGGTAPVISMPAATASVNGYMTSTYASKLDGIAAGATNVTNTNQLTNGAGFITNSGFANSLAANGYQKIEGGTIVQWGVVTTAALGTSTVTLPIAFPSACRSVTLGNVATSSSGSGGSFGYASILSASQIQITNDYATTNNSTTYYWIAIGY